MTSTTRTPRPVEIVEVNEHAAADLNTFEDLLGEDLLERAEAAIDGRTVQAVPVDVDGLVRGRADEVDLEVLREAHPQLAAIVEATQRPDGSIVTADGHRYPSASERDMAAVGIAARAGWDDQTLADLIAACRAHCLPEKQSKATRADYVAKTISKARSRNETEPNRAADDNSDDQQGAFAPDGYRLTDAGNAARLIEVAGDQLRFVHAWGRWLVYLEGRWTVDVGDALVTEHAKEVARGLFLLLPDCADETKKKLFNAAVRAESASGIAAMIRLARAIRGVIIDHEDLDADPYLLNVRNGTVDLRTGRLRTHDPADLLTLQCPVDFDPDATAPLWNECLERWQPDPNMRAYLQLEAGAGATGIPTETVSIHFGAGANGKSKYFGGIQHVLGPYAAVPDKSLLMQQPHQQHPTVKAALFRKRFIVASESKAADALDDEHVKSLTGGDRLLARRMREDFWEFAPTHTLVLFSNHRPTIHGSDEGVWRRVRLFPWEVTIPENERDLHLAEKLQKEAPGILAWTVEGARRFLEEGFDPPDTVRAATDRYRIEEDVVGRFVDEVLKIVDGWTWSSDIRDALDRWCTDEGVPPISMNDVAAVLEERGCTSKRQTIGGRRGTLWVGVGLLTPQPSDQEKRT